MLAVLPMSEPTPTPVAVKKLRSKAKWIVLGAFVLLLALSVKLGLVGFGWAELMAATFPRDESLLAYVPGETSAVAVIDPHQIKLASLGAEDGTLRKALDARRTEIEDATGIDLAFDVDKIVLSSSVIIARGRFDAMELTEKLTKRGYKVGEHKTVRLLERADEDAIAVIDDSLVLYGSAAAVRAAIDAEEADTGLEENEAVLDRLNTIGWDHAFLGTVRIEDQGPSLRAIVTGATGPRAISLGIGSNKGGVAVDVAIEAASAETAEETKKLIDEKRADADGLRLLAGDKLGGLVSQTIKDATVTVVAGEPTVRIGLTITAETIDALSAAVKDAGPQVTDLYKSLRFFQLLMPGM